MRRFIESSRRNDSVGRYLFWVWLVNVGVVFVLLVVIGQYLFREIDLAYNQADYEVTHEIKSIRDRLEDVAVERPSDSLEQIVSRSEWLDGHIRDTLSANFLLKYVTLITFAGQMYTWQKGNPENSEIVFRMGDIPHYEHSSEKDQFDQGRVNAHGCAEEGILHRSFYIHSEGQHLGQIQIGVSAAQLDKQLARSHFPITVSFILIGGIFVVALSVGTFLMWRMVERTRAMDRVNERQTYVANFGRLARKLVHEIRNPLNTIRMQTAVIRNKVREPTEKNLEVAGRQLNSLDNEIVRLETMTRSFLDLGHPPADRLEYINLQEFLEELVNFIRPEFEQIHVEVVLAPQEGAKDLHVHMDRSQMRGVLLNLTKNAREALENGGRLILRSARESRSQARIEVEDTGCGIPSEALPNIFQAQYSHKKGGSGLGLAMAAQIVDNVGGSINVESEVNRGTRFIIKLPLVETGR